MENHGELGESTHSYMNSGCMQLMHRVKVLTSDETLKLSFEKVLLCVICHQDSITCPIGYLSIDPYSNKEKALCLLVMLLNAKVFIILNNGIASG